MQESKYEVTKVISLVSLYQSTHSLRMSYSSKIEECHLAEDNGGSPLKRKYFIFSAQSLLSQRCKAFQVDNEGPDQTAWIVHYGFFIMFWIKWFRIGQVNVRS